MKKSCRNCAAVGHPDMGPCHECKAGYTMWREIVAKEQDEIEADTMHSLSNPAQVSNHCPMCVEGQRAMDRLTQTLADAKTTAQLRGDLLAERDAEVVGWMQEEKKQRNGRIQAEAEVARLTRCLEISERALRSIYGLCRFPTDESAMARNALAEIEKARGKR